MISCAMPARSPRYWPSSAGTKIKRSIVMPTKAGFNCAAGLAGKSLAPARREHAVSTVSFYGPYPRKVGIDEMVDLKYKEAKAALQAVLAAQPKPKLGRPPGSKNFDGPTTEQICSIAYANMLYRRHLAWKPRSETCIYSCTAPGCLCNRKMTKAGAERHIAFRLLKPRKLRETAAKRLRRREVIIGRRKWPVCCI